MRSANRRILARMALLAAVVACMPCRVVLAETATVAVAANFTEAAKELAGLFERANSHKVVYSFGSTGQLYAQLSQGAPFDAFLSADQERPRMAIEAGYAIKGSDFTYATGRIVLFSMSRTLVNGEDTLRRPDFDKLAIANPATAPYGAAAVETMKALAVYDSLAQQLVQGGNIAQTYQFVKTGNAQIGFVALSQVSGNEEGSRWLVPEHLYTPIAQDAVLLKHGEHNRAARAFLQFLQGPQARAVKEKFGYGAGSK